MFLRKIILSSFLLVCLINHCVAQDANLEAKVLYNKAEEAFNNSNYLESLKQLDNVENTLGTTNSRILYLKANCYNNLLKDDWKYATSLTAVLNQFFDITDQNKYPQEKYMDMVSIRVDLNGKIKDYEPGYQLLKNSSNKVEISNYVNNYPKSPHAAVLQESLTNISRIEERQEKDEKRQALEKKYGSLIKKKFVKGVACTSIGSAFLIAGASSIGYATTTSNDGVGISIAGFSGLLLLTASIPLEIVGPIQLAKSIKMKKKIARGELSMNLHPAAFPNGAYGAGVQLHF